VLVALLGRLRLGGLQFKANIEQIVCETPISKKITTAKKWTGGVAQIVQCLLCMHQVLTPVPPKKKKLEDVEKQ
jgi:hypothetical protein